ncbi:predicted protein [Histoplasma mississippiense (nom. inval.)]|uniref:predicted protein n=1 Tax=Ajellomyces capsulatus (strain NAm1 / WU24) TaxID=2059318 RepID=UPI000157B383|nr:predicted protein [Histoplasma mississippiense (nom. inval.)]EDN03193.1 predicted protein [Histoplasma mississippiense (nom. inval.)]
MRDLRRSMEEVMERARSHGLHIPSPRIGGTLANRHYEGWGRTSATLGSPNIGIVIDPRIGVCTKISMT